jgi:hypothetical protein
MVLFSCAMVLAMLIVAIRLPPFGDLIHKAYIAESGCMDIQHGTLHVSRLLKKKE